MARNVVIEAYEKLTAEGYVYKKNGSGTYISEGVIFRKPEQKINTYNCSIVPPKPRTSVSFRTGIPDLTRIPIKKWGQIYHKIALDMKPHQMDYQNALGDESLRTTLAKYLNRVRGTAISPQNILLTNGAAQSFNLLCQFILNKEYALVENPLSNGILHTLKSNGVKIKAIQVDAHGMVTSNLPPDAPKLIFTTPSHQFPTGGILPASRRFELINYARCKNAYIVEDDYDSEFRFDGDPVESLQSMGPDRVIYVGSFSKTFMPALRIGYMVLPNEVMDKMYEAKFVSDIHSPILEQLTLAQFIESGSFERHIHQMRKYYCRKRNLLMNSLRNTFGEKVSVIGANAGLHFVALFEDVIFNEKILHEIKQAGIEIDTVSKHLLNPSNDSPYNNTLIFGYGNIPMNKIEYGIDLLSSVLQNINRK